VSINDHKNTGQASRDALYLVKASMRQVCWQTHVSGLAFRLDDATWCRRTAIGLDLRKKTAPEVPPVAVYVTLYRYTDEGMKRIKEAPKIAESWQREAEKAGVAVKALYWLQGAYDAVTIVESDDEDAFNNLMLAIGAQGYLRTETMRGFGIEDVQRVTQNLR
jgi:uncharacterized protein with GYD domain